MFTVKKRYPLTTTLALGAVLLVTSLTGHAQPQKKELETMQAFLAIVNSYYDVVESTHDIASNNEKAAIIQMQKIQEVYESLGQKANAADILRGVLEDSKSPTIRNAAYMLLADNLKDTGRASEALKLLQKGLAENIAASQ